MARRRELKNVASGFLSSFVSRNNDIDGYWGLGMLCSYARKNRFETVELNLLSGKSTPSSSDTDRASLQYAQSFSRRLVSYRIPVEWITKAIMQITFKNAGRYSLSMPMYRFNCILTICDDMENSRSVALSGYCREHNAALESRSTRVK